MKQVLPLTPSGQTIERLRALATRLESNPRMRRAIKAAIKAMGLGEPVAPKAPRKTES